ncbi:MAG: hypothetical protein Q4F27_00630 [Desulfovibrionaceae bacterium]|nr:hypothetical protein [Desulfovibrionaceae bacterium]
MNNSTPEQGFASLLDWLKERHTAIMAVEAEGLRLLDANDTPGYVAQMRQKAEMLAGLSDDANPRLEALPEPWRSSLGSSLKRFSNSARMALRLNSVFYMSALLYPDEHKPGEPDNLILCINRMEQEKENFKG